MFSVVKLCKNSLVIDSLIVVAQMLVVEVVYWRDQLSIYQRGFKISRSDRVVSEKERETRKKFSLKLVPGEIPHNAAP